MDLVEIRAVPLPFRGPKEELQAAALALASMRIHRTCDFFMDASYELSPATGHTCCVIERIPFFWWIGACFIAMIDSRWITASLRGKMWRVSMNRWISGILNGTFPLQAEGRLFGPFVPVSKVYYGLDKANFFSLEGPLICFLKAHSNITQMRFQVNTSCELEWLDLWL